ncbi:MAG: DegV family protein [Ruminococcaceae bacterium]|nr:DegV family protein [Oscillospiraceae bacterium]
MSVFVSSDSTCDLSRELLEKYNIGITPLYIIMGQDSLKDGLECTPADIFAAVERTGQLCSTAAVSMADYVDFFGEKLKEYDELVHFTISSDMSACYQNACLAAEEFPGRVFVVDSRNLSTGIGHLVLNAAELAAGGKSGAEIKAAVDEKKEKLNVSFVLETLNYIHKGGRCSAVAALGANLLGLKPCIEVRDGRMGVGKKYRGSLKKSLSAYVRDRLAEPEKVDLHRIFVTHSAADDTLAREIAELVKELAPFEEVLITAAGSTISNHCGPNCLGILYYNK